MKKVWITLITTAALLAAAYLFHGLSDVRAGEKDQIKVGFVYIGDESTSYTQNFIMAQHAIEEKYGESVITEVRSNVPEGKERAVLWELAEANCDLVFATSYGYGASAKAAAAEFPDIQFCLATGDNAITDPLENYHTFFGHAYECRYVSGIAAGIKLQELIDKQVITPQQAKVGYVAAYPYAEVISGYTAFFMGVRSACPDAVMLVKYVNSWNSYKKERDYAADLLDAGCIVISQHSDTIGPALACEAYQGEYPVYHIGFNQNMIEVAPTTSLTGCRIDWTPYMLSAVDAVLQEKKIEEVAEGYVNGNDVGAGFSYGWLEMLEVNRTIAAPGMQEAIDRAILDLKNGKTQVFQGDYVGVNPLDESDTIDLKNGYRENERQSYPTFHYVLRDVIQIME